MKHFENEYEVFSKWEYYNTEQPLFINEDVFNSISGTHLTIKRYGNGETIRLANHLSYSRKS